MKRLVLLGMTLTLMGLAGSVSAQTAAQYIAAGNQSYAAKDYAKGAQYYQAATQMDPNSAAGYQGLGNCEYMLGKNSEALAAYEKALNLSPNNAQLSGFVQSLRAKVGASAPAAAATPAATQAIIMAANPGSQSKFELDLSGGIAFSSGQTGFGGGGGGFFSLGGGIGLGARVNFYTFSSGGSGYGYSASASVNFLEALASAKYRFDIPGFHPYILAGVGIADLMTSVSVSGGGVSVGGSSSAIDPMIDIGGGVEFPMGTNMNFFGQLKYSMVFIPGQTVTTAYGSYTAPGGTSTYLPLEVGINFDL